MRRRTLLTTVGVGVFGGCIERGRTEDQGTDDETTRADATQTRTATATPRQRFEKARQGESFSDVQTATELGDDEVGKRARVQLDAGQYTNFAFKVAEESRVEVQGTIADGGPIDLYVMTVPQFNEFQREPASVAAAATVEAKQTIDFTHRLPPDDYLLVFDNTTVGSVSPAGAVQIDFEFVLGPPEASTTSANT